MSLKNALFVESYTYSPTELFEVGDEKKSTVNLAVFQIMLCFLKIKISFINLIFDFNKQNRNHLSTLPPRQVFVLTIVTAAFEIDYFL